MFLLNHVRAGTGSRGPPPLAVGDFEAKINCLGRIWFRERVYPRYQERDRAGCGGKI
jgi:hypothetical protein